ncbi:MAG: HD domain-containing protein [Gammaproteobacteria bacterium]|nr:HD domain-containing protein [Gammaproteobacteria bacterium]MBU1407420.1 HD domain-containing protein [Gammaproteobacteria bacterium]MBU1531533.1 HD domain-containing protein [Gammaproteobacteria bacterium]
MSEDLNTVNPHYLERAIDLGERYEVCASEDIYDANGMKLLAKGATLAPGMQERLIRHKLRKPLETSLSVVDGVTIEVVLEVAKQLLDELPPLQTCAGPASARNASLEATARIGLNNSMTTLLTMSYKSEGQRHFKHTVLVGLIATMLATRAKLSHDDVLAVAHAGLLHDIGEMYLDPAYLKSGAHLKPEEWKHVVVHPKVGQMVLTELTPYPVKVARAVGEHHERMDGSGYPHRYANTQISREGSIVATAETLGGIFMRPDNPLQRASLALKIIPGEFTQEVVSIVSSIAQSAPDGLAAENIRPLADHAPRLNTLNQKLESVLAQCDAIAVSPLANTKSVLDAQQRVSDRIAVIKRSLASSGVWACLQEPQQVMDDMRPEILLELEVVSRELEWRLRDIARDLVLHFPKQNEEISAVFAELIETLDKLD